ncbi:MAG: hypothetical protein BWY47_01818 [Bacteroidetes bacterium ADurb.Bin302]|nr:MAG: hypothetical protein BWY47_01818 [Bacteroidetes bacterium ADurb.Bin302]
MQFLAAACFIAHREKNNDIRVIIVTNDKRIYLLLSRSIKLLYSIL